MWTIWEKVTSNSTPKSPIHLLSKLPSKPQYTTHNQTPGGSHLYIAISITNTAIIALLNQKILPENWRCERLSTSSSKLPSFQNFSRMFQLWPEVLDLDYSINNINKTSLLVFRELGTGRCRVRRYCRLVRNQKSKHEKILNLNQILWTKIKFKGMLKSQPSKT